MLDELVDQVLASSKYRHVSRQFIARIGSIELKRQSSFSLAVKATKNKLHQIASAYLTGNINYAQQMNLLIKTNDLKVTCREIMRLHTSTAERLPILDTFFTTTMSLVSPITRVLDLACGLNPLAIPWMPLEPGAVYHACDIFSDMIFFLNNFLKRLPVQGKAEVLDIGSQIPGEAFDIVLLLKTLPCLEQVDKHIGTSIMEQLNTRHILVSFPVHSIGGKQKGMTATYDKRMEDLTKGKTWNIHRFEFSTELAFLISKHHI